MNTNTFSSLSARGTDEKIKKVLGKLEFLSQVEEYDKIWPDKEHPAICKVTWSNWFLRRLNRENPLKTVSFISSTYKESLELLDSFIQDLEHNNDASKLAAVIMNKLEKSRAGPLNLMISYQDDTNAVSKLNAELEVLDISLQTHQQKLEFFHKAKPITVRRKSHQSDTSLSPYLNSFRPSSLARTHNSDIIVPPRDVTVDTQEKESVDRINE